MIAASHPAPESHEGGWPRARPITASKADKASKAGDSGGPTSGAKARRVLQLPALGGKKSVPGKLKQPAHPHITDVMRTDVMRPDVPTADTGIRQKHNGRSRIDLGTGWEGKQHLDRKYNGGLHWGIDYLKPLYPGQRNTVLLALGGHGLTDQTLSQPGRTLADVGLVYRTCVDEHNTLGLNLFFDWDLNQKHRRASLGLEVMAPWWQLTGNYYKPLTDWKAAPGSRSQPDPTSIEARLLERPAHTYEISLQAGLPLLLDLSAKASLFHVRSDRSSLVDNKGLTESDPHAVALTLNYHAVPLVTFSATHVFRPGVNTNGISLRMLLTFNLDQPLRQQLQKVTHHALFGNDPDMATRFATRHYRNFVDYKLKSIDRDALDIETLGPFLAVYGEEQPSAAHDQTYIPPGQPVTMMAKVKSKAGAPMAGVPMIWKLTRVDKRAGVNHSIILGGPGSPGLTTTTDKVVSINALSNAQGNVYVTFTVPQDENITVSAEVLRSPL